MKAANAPVLGVTAVHEDLGVAEGNAGRVLAICDDEHAQAVGSQVAVAEVSWWTDGR